MCQGCRILNLYGQTASSPKYSSSISSSASDIDEAVETGPGEDTRQAVTLQWTRPSWPQSSVAHTCKRGPRGKKDNEASRINNGSVLRLFFAEIITLLVVDTNRHYQDYIDGLDDGPCPEPDVTNM